MSFSSELTTESAQEDGRYRTIGKQYGVNGKEISALENCNNSALENRKILIQKIEEGLVKQCKRVESWFA